MVLRPGESLLGAPEILRCSEADLYFPGKDPPPRGWGTLGFEFAGAQWFVHYLSDIQSR